jgi:hypothetical protein
MAFRPGGGDAVARSPLPVSLIALAPPALRLTKKQRSWPPAKSKVGLICRSA